jgi:hypothetical protein
MLTVVKQEEKTDGGAAARMMERLGRMPESKRSEIYAFMETSESARQLITYALGATKDELSELLGIVEADLHRRRSVVTINGIRCDPTTAEHIYTSVAGHDCYVGEGFRRFDEVLYRNRDGFWFLMRPLAPDEAREWLWDGHHDEVLARQLFPDDED